VAIEEAKADKKRPSFITIKTQIGYGCPAKQGKASAHGEPLGEDNVAALRETLGWPTKDPFAVPDEVYANYAKLSEAGEKAEKEWNALFAEYQEKFPEMKKLWQECHEAVDKNSLLNDEAYWAYEDKAQATRSLSGKYINRLKDKLPQLFGGSADLGPSNKTVMDGAGDFSKEDYAGRNIHFGVRELAMAAIANGLALHGGLRPYVATFFVFSDYTKPMLRLSSLMKLPVTYVFTHDSIGVGEDGPTHEPIEQMASLRCTPNVVTIRPADAEETAGAWIAALKRKDGPTCILTSRQNLPILEGGKRALVEKGAYVVFQQGDVSERTVGFIASGSEVSLAVDAAKKLASEGIAVRVVSMPSWELFAKQGDDYVSEILPRIVKKRVVVEAGSRFGWERWSVNESTTRYVTIDGFGASGPCKELAVKFGFTVENVYAAARSLV
jgi:transketolase